MLNLQKSRNNCDRTKFRGIFSRMNNFPMIFQAQFVSFSQLPMEWWRYSWKAALDQIKSDLTNISNSFSCFLATYREKLENNPMFPI